MPTINNQVTRLKKQKADLESRLREQEEELDDLAGQVVWSCVIMMIMLVIRMRMEFAHIPNYCLMQQKGKDLFLELVVAGGGNDDDLSDDYDADNDIYIMMSVCLCVCL